MRRRSLLTSLLAGLLSAGAVAAGPLPELVPVTAAELAARVRAADGPVLVNVWATWCVPCREEFPDLLRLRRRYLPAGLTVVLVSADFAAQGAQAQRFLAEQGVDFTSFHKRGGDEPFIDSLSPEWSGALPATFVYDRDHRLVTWWQGQATYEQLEDAVRPLLAVPTKGDAKR